MYFAREFIFMLFISRWEKDFCDGGPSTISDQKMGPGTQVVWDASVQLGMASSAFHKVFMIPE